MRRLLQLIGAALWFIVVQKIKSGDLYSHDLVQREPVISEVSALSFGLGRLYPPSAPPLMKLFSYEIYVHLQ